MRRERERQRHRPSYTPDEFAELKRIGLELGFGHVESGPLVRSSYHAHETADAWHAASK
jgi:lipoate synthase